MSLIATIKLKKTAKKPVIDVYNVIHWQKRPIIGDSAAFLSQFLPKTFVYSKKTITFAVLPLVPK